MKKTIIFSLFLIVSGFAVLGLIFVAQRRDHRIDTKRQRRLETQVGQVTDMVDKQADIHSFKHIVSGSRHQEERWMHNETKELLLTVSNVLTFSGGSILCFCLLIGTSRIIAKGINQLVCKCAKAQNRKTAPEQKQIAPTNANEKKKGLFARQMTATEISSFSAKGIDVSSLLCDDENALCEGYTSACTQTCAERAAENQVSRAVCTQDAGPDKDTLLSSRPVKRGQDYGEKHHIEGKPREIVDLYRALDKFCTGLEPGVIEKKHLAKYIRYSSGKNIFCCVHVYNSGLRVWLKLYYPNLESAPEYVRDVSNIGHWGVGDVELTIDSLDKLQNAKSLITRSFEESC